MAKFYIYSIQKIYRESEIEATTANEAEAIWWDADDLGKEVNDDIDLMVDAVQDEFGNAVTDFDKIY